MDPRSVVAGRRSGWYPSLRGALSLTSFRAVCGGVRVFQAGTAATPRFLCLLLLHVEQYDRFWFVYQR